MIRLLPWMVLSALAAFYFIFKDVLVYSSDVIDMAQIALCGSKAHCSYLEPLLNLSDRRWLSQDLWPNLHRFPALPWLYSTISKLTGVSVQTYQPMVTASLLGYGVFAFGLWVLTGGISAVTGIGLLWALVHPHLLREAFTGDSTVWDAAGVVWQLVLVRRVLGANSSQSALRWSILAGLAAGAALLFRYVSVIWMLPLVWVMWRREKKWALVWALGAFSVTAPWLSWVYQTTGNPFYSITAEIVRLVRPAQDYPWFMLKANPLSLAEQFAKAVYSFKRELRGTVEIGAWSAGSVLVPLAGVFFALTARMLWQVRAQIRGAWHSQAVIRALVFGLVAFHLVLLSLDYVPRYSRILIPVFGIAIEWIWTISRPSQNQRRLAQGLLVALLIGNLWVWSRASTSPEFRQFVFAPKELSEDSQLSALAAQSNLIISTQPGNAALQFGKKTLPLPVIPEEFPELIRTAQRAGYSKALVLVFSPLQDWYRYREFKGYGASVEGQTSTGRHYRAELLDLNRMRNEL